MEHQLTENMPPPRFSSASAMKDFFEVKDTKALGKGKGRPGKQKSRENQDTEADEGDMGDGDEDAERASIAKAPIGVILLCFHK